MWKTGNDRRHALRAAVRNDDAGDTRERRNVAICAVVGLAGVGSVLAASNIVSSLSGVNPGQSQGGVGIHVSRLILEAGQTFTVQATGPAGKVLELEEGYEGGLMPSGFVQVGARKGHIERKVRTSPIEGTPVDGGRAVVTTQEYFFYVIVPSIGIRSDTVKVTVNQPSGK